MKKIPIALIMAGLIFSACQKGSARTFDNTIPTGVEVKDSFLENLFIPEFPYNSVKVVERPNSTRFVVIQAKNKVSDDMFKQYCATLGKRGISVKNDWDTKHGVLISAKVILVRELSKTPYVIEVSEAYHNAENVAVGLSYNIAWNAGPYIVYWIDKDFGKKFKTMTIYPDKDAPCPLPPFVGKYPQSKSVSCYRVVHLHENLNKEIERSDKAVFLFVSEDSPENIRDYYKELLIKRFKTHGMTGLEKYKWSTGTAGAEIRDYHGGDIGWLEGEFEHNRSRDYGILGRMDKITWEDLKQDKGKFVIPNRGEVFKVEIYKGRDIYTKGLNWIKVYYETDKSEIQKIIKTYSEIDKR